MSDFDRGDLGRSFRNSNVDVLDDLDTPSASDTLKETILKLAQSGDLSQYGLLETAQSLVLLVKSTELKEEKEKTRKIDLIILMELTRRILLQRIDELQDIINDLIEKQNKLNRDIEILNGVLKAGAIDLDNFGGPADERLANMLTEYENRKGIKVDLHNFKEVNDFAIEEFERKSQLVDNISNEIFNKGEELKDCVKTLNEIEDSMDIEHSYHSDKIDDLVLKNEERQATEDVTRLSKEQQTKVNTFLSHTGISPLP